MTDTHTRTQHTPGPWDADSFYQGTLGKLGYWAVNRPEHGAGIRVYGDFHQAQADARLIAAAPDLLAALELARQALVNLQAEGESRYMPIVRQADAAIRKARGEE